MQADTARNQLYPALSARRCGLSTLNAEQIQQTTITHSAGRLCDSKRNS